MPTACVFPLILFCSFCLLLSPHLPPLIMLQTSFWKERFYIPQQFSFPSSSVDLSVRNTEWCVRRAQQKQILSNIHCPECSSAEACRCPSSPAPLPSTQSSASIIVFDCNFLSFCHKGSFPKPSPLQQQHPYPCGPQPTSSYLINSVWQKGKSF